MADVQVRKPGPKIKSLVGQKFGRLEVKKFADHIGKRFDIAWRCLCECGSTVVVRATHLKSGHTTSCGCLQKEVVSALNTTHNQSDSREYDVWVSMLQRCNNHQNPSYHRYGARGIIVCEEWNESFEVFIRDMGRRPSPAHSIDRINNNGNYEPLNCRWATRREQARNMRSNVILDYNGKSLCLSEWAEQVGIPLSIIDSRLRRGGWSVEKALTTPPQFRRSRNKDHSNA